MGADLEHLVLITTPQTWYLYTGGGQVRQIGMCVQYLQIGATVRSQPSRESADQVHVASLMVGRGSSFQFAQVWVRGCSKLNSCRPQWIV